MRFINLKNLSFLYVWQISGYLLSFLLMPYLARVLQVHGFGEYSYVVGVNTYLWILIEWGYPTGGVRDVSSNRDDYEALQNVFWKIIYSKASLIIPGILTLLALSAVSDPAIRHVVFISGLCTLMGSAFGCDWFAQGMERLGAFIFISITVRIVLTIITFVLVRSEADADLAALLHGAVGLFAGIAGFVTILAMFKFLPKKQSPAEIARSVAANFSLFLARANGILYVSAPPLVLGMVANATQIGIYSGADKIARICVMLIGPIGLIVTPRIFSSMQKSSELAAMLSGRYLVIQAAITIPMSLGLFIFAPQIVYLVLGNGYDQSAVILRLLSPTPLLVGLSGALANQFLVPIGLDRSLAVLSLVCASAYVLLLTAMTITMAAIGAGIALLLAEILMIGGAAFLIMRGNRDYVHNAWMGIRTFNPLELIRSR